MVNRTLVPYVGVLALGAAFVAFAAYGFLTLSSNPGLGPGFGRVALSLFLALGVFGMIVAGADLYRHHLDGE